MVRCRVTAKRHGTIRDLDKKDLLLVTDSQDVREVKNYFGNRPAVKDFGGFLISRDGPHDEAYGYEGNVPEFHKSVWKVELKCK